MYPFSFYTDPVWKFRFS